MATQSFEGKYVLPLKKDSFFAVAVIHDSKTHNDPEWFKILSLLLMSASNSLRATLSMRKDIETKVDERTAAFRGSIAASLKDVVADAEAWPKTPPPRAKRRPSPRPSAPPWPPAAEAARVRLFALASGNADVLVGSGQGRCRRGRRRSGRRLLRRPLPKLQRGGAANMANFSLTPYGPVLAPRRISPAARRKEQLDSRG